MNKTEMAEKLAKKCDLSQAKAQEIVNCIFDTKAGSGHHRHRAGRRSQGPDPRLRHLRLEEPRRPQGPQPRHRPGDLHRGQEVPVLQARQGPEGPRGRLSALAAKAPPPRRVADAAGLLYARQPDRRPKTISRNPGSSSSVSGLSRNLRCASASSYAVICPA